MMLGWTEVVGHESMVSGKARVGWEVNAWVAGAAAWERGVQEWAWFVKVVALWLGVWLWQSQFALHCRSGVRDVEFAGKGSYYAG